MCQNKPDSTPGDLSRLTYHRLLLALLVAASVVRLVGLGKFSLWNDEASTVYNALHIFELRPFQMGTAFLDSPILHIIEHLLLLFGRSEFWLRLAPATFGMLSVWAAAAAACTLLGRRVGLLTAVFLAFSPFHVYYAQELRCYTIYTFFSCLHLYCFLRLAERESRKWWVCFGVSAALAMYAHVFASFTIAICSAWLLLFRWNRRTLVRLALSALAVGVFVSPLIVIALLCARGSREPLNWYLVPIPISIAITYKNFIIGFTPNKLLFTTAFFLFLGFGALGAFALRRDIQRLTLLAALAFAPVLAVFVFSRVNPTSIYCDRYMIFSSVPAFMLAATGIAWFRTARLQVAISAVVAAVMMAGVVDCWQGDIHPAPRHRTGAKPKIDNRGVAQYIESHFKEGDVVAHTCHVTFIPAKIYLEQPQLYVALTQDNIDGALNSYPWRAQWEFLGMVPVRVQAVGPETKRVWLVQSWWEPDDLDEHSELLAEWFYHHWSPLLHKKFFGINLYLFARRDRTVTQHESARTYDDGFNRFYAKLDAEGLATVSTFPDSSGMLFQEEADEAASVVSFANKVIDLAPNTTPEPEITIDEHVYSLVAIRRSDTGDTAEYCAYPTSATGPFSARFSVRNNTDEPKEYAYEVTQSALVVEAESLRKKRVDSDAWRLLHCHNPSPPHRPFNDTAMTVRLAPLLMEDDFLYTDIAVPPGRYDVFARILVAGEEENRSRAYLGFELDGEQIGTLPTNSPGAESGWRWVKVGQASVDTGEHELAVRAENRENLAECWADLDKVVFLPTGTVAQGEKVIVVASDEIVVGPNSQEQTVVMLGPRSTGWHRFDIRVEKIDTKDAFNIHFWTQMEP